MKYDRTTRWLHAGLALTVVIQLLSSLLMVVPHPGRVPTEPGYTLFHIHRWSGITVVSLLLLHWLWQLSGHLSNGWGHLFPWFSPRRMQRLMGDLKALPGWLRNGFPDQQKETLPMAGRDPRPGSAGRFGNGPDRGDHLLRHGAGWWHGAVGPYGGRNPQPHRRFHVGLSLRPCRHRPAAPIARNAADQRHVQPGAQIEPRAGPFHQHTGCRGVAGSHWTRHTGQPPNSRRPENRASDHAG